MGKVVPHKSRIEMDRFYGCCQKMCQTVFTQTRAGYFVFSSFSFGVIEKETWPTDAAAAALVAGKCVQQHMFFLVFFFALHFYISHHWLNALSLSIFYVSSPFLLCLGGRRGHKLKMPKLSYTHAHTDSLTHKRSHTHVTQ